MTIEINETRSERHKESKQVFPKRPSGKNRITPASRDKWAEALATADRYF